MFHVWFTLRSSSKDSMWRTTKRTRISSTGHRVGDSFRKRWQNKVETQFQCRHLQEGRRLWVLEYRWSFRTIVWLDSKEQISELQFDKFLNHQSFLFWKIRFKNQVTTCPDFPSETMSRIKEVEMVDSLEELKVLTISFWEDFSKLRDAGREDCFCSEQNHPEFSLQEEGLSRGTERTEGGPVSTRKTDRLHDLRPLSSDWRSWPSIRLCWLIFCHPSWR